VFGYIAWMYAFVGDSFILAQFMACSVQHLRIFNKVITLF